MHLFPISSQKITFVLHIFETAWCISAILKFGAPMSTPVSIMGNAAMIHLHQLDSPSTAGWSFLSFDLVVFKDFFIFKPLVWGDNPI